MRLKKEMCTRPDKRAFSHSLFLYLYCTLILGCASSKPLPESVKPAPEIVADKQSVMGFGHNTGEFSEILVTDDHMSIFAQIKEETPLLTDIEDAPSVSIGTEKISSESKGPGVAYSPESVAESAVANQIVENYLQSKNKEPGGHCLNVSKRRFEKAYEDVYGHSFYQDLPDSMARATYSPREVFDFLYFSTSGAHEGWQSLPVEYRGKGNAGALAFAGMGTLVDWFGIWTGELRPGAPMQVWKHRDDYELVVKGEKTEDFDPFGHSFIFMSYVRDEKNNITGIRIADQGYQSYRPLLPRDYEVWWAVNLSR